MPKTTILFFDETCKDGKNMHEQWKKGQKIDLEKGSQSEYKPATLIKYRLKTTFTNDLKIHRLQALIIVR